MIERIKLFIEASNLSQSKLADDLGVNRSSISHILSGRNNPSLNFIHKFIQTYPEISLEWLLFGEGAMIKTLNDKNSFVQKQKELDAAELAISEKESDLTNAFQRDLFSFNVIENSKKSDTNPIEDKIIEDKEEKASKLIDEFAYSMPSENKNKLEDDKKSIETLSFKLAKDVVNKSSSRVLIFYSDNSYEEYYPKG